MVFAIIHGFTAVVWSRHTTRGPKLFNWLDCLTQFGANKTEGHDQRQTDTCDSGSLSPPRCSPDLWSLNAMICCVILVLFVCFWSPLIQIAVAQIEPRFFFFSCPCLVHAAGAEPLRVWTREPLTSRLLFFSIGAFSEREFRLLSPGRRKKKKNEAGHTYRLRVQQMLLVAVPVVVAKIYFYL